MAVETKRGCGFRKAGGIYLRGVLDDAIPVTYLPFCIANSFNRSLAWANPELLFETCADPHAGGYRALKRIGLVWVGSTHYSPDEFTKEAIEQGISRRLGALPADFLPGSPIAAAHCHAIPIQPGEIILKDEFHRTIGKEYWPFTRHCPRCERVPEAKAIANGARTAFSPLLQLLEHRDYWSNKSALAFQLSDFNPTRNEPAGVGGVFLLFKATHIEVVLPRAVATDPDIQRKCQQRGVVIVSVPDTDPDHVPDGWKLPRFLLDDWHEPTFPFCHDDPSTDPATEDL